MLLSNDLPAVGEGKIESETHEKVYAGLPRFRLGL